MGKTLYNLNHWKRIKGIFFYCPDNIHVEKALYLSDKGNVYTLFPWENINGDFLMVKNIYTPQLFFTKRYYLSRILGDNILTLKLDIPTLEIVGINL